MLNKIIEEYNYITIPAFYMPQKVGKVRELSIKCITSLSLFGVLSLTGMAEEL
jgi:hypothetical protein